MTDARVQAPYTDPPPTSDPGIRSPSRVEQARVVPTRERILALGLSLGCMALLVVAWTLTPASEGHGTHQQLGLLPCSWAAAIGKPCPTCGMTTAFAAAADARPRDALAAQPMGAAMALLTSVAAWGSLHVAVFGSRLGRVASRLLVPRILWWVAGAWALSWIVKLWGWNHSF